MPTRFTVTSRLNALHRNTSSRRRLAFWGYSPTQCVVPTGFGPYDENTMIPRFTSPEQFHIVVTGGAGKTIPDLAALSDE